MKYVAALVGSTVAVAVFWTVLAQGAGELDLAASSADATIIGAGFGDQVSRVATGDVNGDGLADIILGAPHSDGPNKGEPDRGAAYVFFGVGGFSGTKDLAAGAQNVVLFGGEAFDSFGRALATGDVNGDGIDDIIVGAQGDGAQNERLNAGEVYVIYGGQFTKAVDIAAGQQDVTIVGGDVGDDAGVAVAAGDVNGDGIDDIIVGADDAAGPGNSRPNAGEVHIIFGGALSPTIDLAAGASATIFGADAGDDVGTALAVGDVDGDGRADAIIGADDAAGPGNSRPDAGEAHVVAGSALAGAVDLAGAPHLTVAGAEAGDNLGSLVAAGDVNGDGRADVIAAADTADGAGRPDAGEVHVAFGRSPLSGTVDVGRGQGDLTIVGAAAGDELGTGLSAGDVTGDCIADLLVGATKADGPGDARVDAGEAFVLAGSAGVGGTFDLGVQAPTLTVSGADAGDDLGKALATGAVLGDGAAELVALASKADGTNNERTDAGEAYLIDLGGGTGCAGPGSGGGGGAGGAGGPGGGSGGPGGGPGGGPSGSAGGPAEGSPLGPGGGPGGASAHDGVRVGGPAAGQGAGAANGRGLSEGRAALALASALVAGVGALGAVRQRRAVVARGGRERGRRKTDEATRS